MSLGAGRSFRTVILASLAKFWKPHPGPLRGYRDPPSNCPRWRSRCFSNKATVQPPTSPPPSRPSPPPPKTRTLSPVFCSVLPPRQPSCVQAQVSTGPTTMEWSPACASGGPLQLHPEFPKPLSPHPSCSLSPACHLALLTMQWSFWDGPLLGQEVHLQIPGASAIDQRSSSPQGVPSITAQHLRGDPCSSGSQTLGRPRTEHPPGPGGQVGAAGPRKAQEPPPGSGDM